MKSTMMKSTKPLFFLLLVSFLFGSCLVDDSEDEIDELETIDPNGGNTGGGNTGGGNSSDFGFIDFTLTGNRAITQFNQCNSNTVQGIANDEVTTAVFIEGNFIKPTQSVSFVSDYFIIHGGGGTFPPNESTDPWVGVRTTILDSNGQVSQTTYISTAGTGQWTSDGTYIISANVRELVHNGGADYELTGSVFTVSAALKYDNPCN